jgi:transposase
MRKRELQVKESKKLLKKKANQQKHVKIRDRIRVIICVIEGMTNGEIAKKLDFSIGWVKNWISQYGKHGFVGLYGKPRPGAPVQLAVDQIASLEKKILAGPGPESILSRYRVSDIRELIKQSFNVTYSPSGTYMLMQRMNLSHIKPRPKHEKNSPKVMGEWKKK